MKKMRAVRLFAPGDIRCVMVEQPSLKEKDDVLIKVKACGVCGSDIIRVMKKGAHFHPITIGHEFSGEVVAVGEGVNTLEPRDRVTVMPLISCGQCDYCRVGEYASCNNYKYYGSRIDGAMAEYIIVTAGNVLKLPDGVDYEAGAMTDPASVGLHAVRTAGLEPGFQALVIGMGAIGFFTLQWLKRLGASRVIVVDVFREKLELAKSLGADICLNGKVQDVVKAIEDSTKGKGVDVAIELAGNSSTQIHAIQAVRKKGTVVYCGISYTDLLIPIQVLDKILRGELRIKGSWNSSIAPLPINEWQTSLFFMDGGMIKSAPLISHRFRLEECVECFDMIYNRSEVFNKVLFLPEE